MTSLEIGIQINTTDRDLNDTEWWAMHHSLHVGVLVDINEDWRRKLDFNWSMIDLNETRLEI